MAANPKKFLYQNDAYINGSPIDWSPDGKYLSLDLESRDGIFSNWIMPLTGEPQDLLSRPPPPI